MVRRRRSRPRRRWLPLLVAAGVVAGVGGLVWIGGGGSSGGTSNPPPCLAQTAELPADVAAAPRTLVLLDRTRSARGSPEGAGTPNDYVWALEGTVRAAVEQGHTVSIAGFDGSTATTTWATAVSTFRGDPTSAAFDRKAALDCLLRRLREVATARPLEEGSDILGALQAAARQLGPDRPAGSLVVVATDGLANVGCADLNGAAIGEPAQIPAIVRNCTATGSLPQLQGVEVRLLGLGHPGPGQPVPASRHVAWLQRLWDAVCIASTDRQCLDQQLGDGGARPEPLPSDAAADPAIEFPRIRTQQVPLGWMIELPESLLFETARADLLASADATLDDAVDEIRRLRGRVVRVEGHTDSRGARAYNLRLSERRAAAVAAALGQRGTAVAEVVGHGETRPLVRREYRSDGTPDLRAMARNRRVQLVLAGPEP